MLGDWRKLSNMKVIIIPIVISAFGTVTKGFLKRLEDLEVGERVETIQTKVFFTPWEFFTSVLADSRSLEFEWQQVS